MATLQNLQAKSNEELIAMLLAAQVARTSKLTLKVGKAGGISVYGMGKWPVTLYRSQWERLLDHGNDIRAFITANADVLAVKA